MTAGTGSDEPDAPHHAEVLDAFETTWPAAAREICGPFLIRQGAGGGRKVSSVTALPQAVELEGDALSAAIDRAATRSRTIGQPPLFRVLAGEPWLETALADTGYVGVDPTLVYLAPASRLHDGPPPPLTAYTAWPPIAAQRHLWAEAGVGPSRLATMARAEGPHVSLIGRRGHRAVATAFVACGGRVAMMHALEVAPPCRRAGIGRGLVAAAAHWAEGQGARWLAVAVPERNEPARNLYERLGMEIAERYHYRMSTAPKPDPTVT